MDYINKLLHRAATIPTRTSPTPPSGVDSSSTPSKAAEHEVKVRFAREFADAGSITTTTTYSAPESLSSASSFQSLNSTFSAKSSSGICPDSSEPTNLSVVQNTSYANPDISGIDDLIFACAAIQLNNEEDHLLSQNSQDLSHDQTFASAVDEPVGNLTRDITNDTSSVTLESSASEHAGELTLPSLPTFSSLLASTESTTKFSESDATEDEIGPRSQFVDSPLPMNDCDVARTSPPQTVNESPAKELDRSKDGVSVDNLSTNVCDNVEWNERDGDREIVLDETPSARPNSPITEKDSLTKALLEDSNTVSKDIELSPLKVYNSSEVNITPRGTDEVKTVQLNESPTLSEDIEEADPINSITEKNIEETEPDSSDEQLNTTVTLQDVSLNLEAVPQVEQYEEFNPQRQSTTLSTLDIVPPNFAELKSAAEEVANDIFKSSFNFTEDTNCFVKATPEIFQDPSSFDFLINHGNTNTINRLRTESLYVKFDPLFGDISMLPQGNGQPIEEEQNGKSESIPVNHGTPRRNPAIAAIDRLLVYSPICTNIIQKNDEPEQKMANKEQTSEDPKLSTPLITDINMSKELEMVRATVVQLEEELEKQKKEYEAELDKRELAYQDKINKLQAQMAQEVKSKSQMTVVVEEYEKSISRLLTERERDRTSLQQEIARLHEELETATAHLNNTEAAFNDVHQKYERLKGVVSAYKSNESVLKESIQENMETIKGLETRYDHLKNHAMTQLEKANFELETIRKQHDDEIVKLHAMVRKAELKSNSLAELVEQKTKENKELAQILDEVIARVGHQNAE